MIRILLVDDHKIVRNGLKTILGQYDDLTVVGEADNGVELLKMLPDALPDVVLMDISMPFMNGVETALEMKTAAPDVKILMLSMHEEPEYVIRSIKSGASGYLTKTAEQAELVEAIRTVSRGEKYFNSEISKAMLESFFPRSSEPQVHRDLPISLTPREKEILKHVTDGMSTKEIASRLFISPRTVETHRVNMMKKLDVSNTAELVKLAVTYNLI